MSRKYVNANSLESGMHQTLDTTVKQNIEPISTRPTESSEATSTQHHHDHDHVQISTTGEQIVTIQLDKENTTVENQQTKIFELDTNSQTSLKICGSELQNDLGLNPEPVITIELETPEDNIPAVNNPLKNKSEDALSNEIFTEVDFPPEYFQNETTDNRNYSDENTIDDYYEIEPTTGTGNLQWNQNIELNPITNFSRDTELEEDVLNGWRKVENDQVPDHGPFTDIEGLNFSMESPKPKDFFNQLFGESMFTIMARETNA